MDTPSRRAKPVATRTTSTQSITQPAQALASVTRQESQARITMAQHLRSNLIPILQREKTARSLQFSEYSKTREYYLMAGCISSPSSDIFAHMDPDQVLIGLLEDPEHMVRLEHQLQEGDRCLWSCEMVQNKIAACESLLTQRLLQCTRMLFLLEQETPEASEERGKLLNLMKQGRQDLAKADDALEDALKALEELKESP